MDMLTRRIHHDKMGPQRPTHNDRQLFANHGSLQLLGLLPYHEKAPTSAIEKQLTELSMTILDCLNTRDWDNPTLEFLAPDFQTSFDTSNKTWLAKGSKEVVALLRNLMETLPNYKSTFMDVGGVVDERTGKGSVWVLRFLSGLPDGLRRETVNVLDWERRKGSWYCVRYRGLRGPPGSDFGEDVKVQDDSQKQLSDPVESRGGTSASPRSTSSGSDIV